MIKNSCYTCTAYHDDFDCSLRKQYLADVIREDEFKILLEIHGELKRAEKKHGPMLSTAHGAFVVCQKADELARAVAAEKSDGLNDDIREEAVQVGAMALRFLKDLGGQR